MILLGIYAFFDDSDIYMQIAEGASRTLRESTEVILAEHPFHTFQ